MSPRRAAKSDAEEVLGTEDASLLDIVDNVLNKGVVLSGDLTIALANVDLVYARLSVLLCAADKVLPYAEGKRGKSVSTSGPRRRYRRPPLKASQPVSTKPKA